jgi:hypothetical protein
MSIRSECGTGKREYLSRVSSTFSASRPAARAFQRPSGVSR